MAWMIAAKPFLALLDLAQVQNFANAGVASIADHDGPCRLRGGTWCTRTVPTPELGGCQGLPGW